MAKEKKGNRKIGRGVKKASEYRVYRIREKNKIRRILKSSGKKAAAAYAVEHGLTSYLNSLLARKPAKP